MYRRCERGTALSVTDGKINKIDRKDRVMTEDDSALVRQTLARVLPSFGEGHEAERQRFSRPRAHRTRQASSASETQRRPGLRRY